MSGLGGDRNQKASLCSKGRVLIASVVVVLCASGVGIAVYFAITATDEKPINWTTGRTNTEAVNVNLTEGRNNIFFELSQTAAYIGETNVSMTCIVSKYAGLKRVDILHKKDEAGTEQMIATISSNSSFTNKSRMTLVETKMDADSAVLGTAFASALACQDKGLYYCRASGELVTNQTLELNPLGKPHKPTLVLNKDMLEGKQMEKPFTCEGDVGYPAGKLVLASNSLNYFFPNITDINTTISNETCQIKQKISFYYAFSKSWQGKEIRCSAVNDNSLGPDEVPPFDSQTVHVLPADYCQTLPNGFYYHPYYCSYYIDCVNGSVNIKECPAAQCFGLNETIGCSICENAICAKDIVANVRSKSNTSEIIPLLDVKCSMYINCTDKMVHECPGKECFNISSTTCISGPPPPSCEAALLILSASNAFENSDQNLSEK
ncbi:hypothetical protein CHS0354_041824 [Potamilus streckersoni]|uniref:Chitin-binding type-2 domain-containing protein n=1 Tax=Potamilus streckersoni TaxID=2493646 RepID=A0AAE0W6D0_9BIVA|nr:hypothetical protein CHS0354_041824 [Potamilus streckersoni]